MKTTTITTTSINTNAMKVIVAGIGTDVGKTVVSAILCQANQANYWKPVQAGDLDYGDSHQLRQLVSRNGFKVIPETYRLTEAMSPHAAAKIDRVTIVREKLLHESSQHIEESDNLIIELAGGLMVPLSENYLNINFIKDVNLPVILVVQDYLGSINHTMLSIELLRTHKIDIKGLIFNGEANKESREFIQNYHPDLTTLLEIPQASKLDPSFIEHYAKAL